MVTKTRKALHIQKDVAETFRELAKATQKDQSDLLRDLMCKDITYTNSVTINNKMANRVEGYDKSNSFHNAEKSIQKGDD